jgi:hypothetical protein
VFLSCPNHLRDWRCEYDRESELWRADIGFGTRYGTILDANKACAWVVATDGRVSDALSAPIRWKLPE